MTRRRPQHPPITFTDPEMRTATVAEIAQVTGYSEDQVRRITRSGKWEPIGGWYIASEINPNEGSYHFFLKPFLRMFRGEVIPVKQTTEEVAKAASFIKRVEFANRVLDDERMVG